MSQWESPMTSFGGTGITGLVNGSSTPAILQSEQNIIQSLSTLSLPSSLATNHMVKMLAVLEQLESTNHTDNIGKYFLLLIFKSGLDTTVLYFCSQKWHTNFLSMCSFSIAIADLLITFLMGTVWFLGTERSFVSPCFLLANASAIYGALPLPMMSLGFLDYCLDETYSKSQTTFCKLLRNVAFTLLVWMYAAIPSFGSVTAEQVELDYVTGKALVCVVGESALITVFIATVFTAILFTVLPFWSRIPHWIREADKIYEARAAQENKRSDLLFTTAQMTETKGNEYYQEANIRSPPPLWLSLTLAFFVFWMPYIAMSVVCMLCGIAVPAYISVNLLWLECANSLLLGVGFWIKSKTHGPYNQLPNICEWQIYWHLSKGTQLPQLPVTVYKPSKATGNSLLHI